MADDKAQLDTLIDNENAGNVPLKTLKMPRMKVAFPFENNAVKQTMTLIVFVLNRYPASDNRRKWKCLSLN